MEPVRTLVLDDNLEYYVVAEENILNVKYLYLSEIGNEKNFCVRKIKNIAGTEKVCPLDDIEEFNSAMIFLSNKYNKKAE